MKTVKTGINDIKIAYMTCHDAAEKWGVSLRYVQRLVSAGRVPGVKRYGRSWMIPRNSAKPDDPRKSKPSAEAKTRFAPYGMLCSDVPLDRRDAKAFLASLGPQAMAEFEAETAYLRGDYEKAKQRYDETGFQDPFYLCAAFTAMVASASTGDYPLFQRIEKDLDSLGEEDLTDEDRLSLDLVRAGIALSMFVPSLAPAWLQQGNILVLPHESATFGIYLLARYYQANEQYETMRAVASAVLLTRGPHHPMTNDVCFYMLCAAGNAALRRNEEAEALLLKAMEIYLPKGVIAPFVEYVTMMGGLMEKCLKEHYPAYYKQIMQRQPTMQYNWLSFHNRYAQNRVALILTSREYRLASMAAHGATNQQIAENLGCSVSYVKKVLSVVFEKLFINRRAQLRNYIL